MSKSKFLIVRFSSIGDVAQCLSVPFKLREVEPTAEVHWITRSDMAPLLKHHPDIDRIHHLEKKEGLKGFIKLALHLRREKFTHVYDAHNNLRSRLLCWFLRTRLLSRPNFIRKSQKRWKRFLLFRLRINNYIMPFSGQRDLIEPLKKWGINPVLPPPPQLFIQTHELERALNLISFEKYVALAPSAAFFLKRWPQNYWEDLISRSPNLNFVLLGGPTDSFLDNMVRVSPSRVLNLAGKLSLRMSAAVIKNSKALISNDTGMLHFAEQLGHPCIALMGPAPFGFPSRKSTIILERNLSCRPCSKHGQGPCKNKKKFHECLVAITPDEVQVHLLGLLK